MPAAGTEAVDRFEPGVTGRVVSERDIREAIAVEIAYANDGVVRIRATDLHPTRKGAVADLLDPGVARRAVPKQYVLARASRVAAQPSRSDCQELWKPKRPSHRALFAAPAHVGFWHRPAVAAEA